MKRSIIKYALGAALFVMAGCTGNYEDFNRNPNETTREELERDGYIIASSMRTLQNWVVSTNVNTCQFTDCLLGGPLGGYFSDSQSNWNPNKISTYNANNNWNRVMFQDIIPHVYPSLNDLKSSTDNIVPLSVATVLKVASMHRITDTYGPIPYSQIGTDGKIQVAYDSQQSIYNKFFDELDEAIANLTEHKTEAFSKEADLIYGGSVEQWIKFANSLKLRLAMRIVYADETKARQKAEEAVNHEVGTMAVNADNAALATFGIDGNPIYVASNVYNSEGSKTGGDHHASADLTCYMNGYADPRRAAYFTNSDNAAYLYTGLRSGITIPAPAVVFNYSGVKIGVASPLQWMNVAEVMFLKAEGAARGWNMGGSAKDFYELGVTRSFEQWGATGAAAYLANSTSVPTVYIDPAGIYGYNNQLTNITIAWNESDTFEKKLERIIVQKWIANWTLGNESWAERRRTGYPKMMPVVYNGSGGTLADNAIPKRLPYPLEEYQTNTANVSTAVSTLLGGTDNMATRVWWDKKN